MSHALVIGLGRMGRFHARALADLGYDVITVDPDASTGADFQHPPLALRIGRCVEVVCVATPIEHLAEVAASWIGFEGHLLVEKPFAATPDDARKLAADLQGQRVAVGYVERFNPAVRWLAEKLDGGTVIEAEFVRQNPRPSSNVRIDLTSHDLDLAAYLGLDGVVCDFRSAANAKLVREINVTMSTGRIQHVDLTAHDTSPLHAMWHAFLAGKPGYATPEDAVAVWEAIEWQKNPASRGAAFDPEDLVA